VRRLPATGTRRWAAPRWSGPESRHGRGATVTTAPPCGTPCAKGLEPGGCRGCEKGTSTFLHDVRRICDANGAVFILDEMITGFRWHLNGAQTFYDVQPDLATFGKGMANGFSVAALVGRREIMDIGGILDEGAERVFLVSTTHGGEMSGLGAFMETVKVYEELPVVDHLWKYGRNLMDGMNAIAASLSLSDHFSMVGYPCSPGYVTKDAAGAVSLELRTLFSQEMIRHGVLMPWIALSYSHGEPELSQTLEAAEKALKTYARALDEGTAGYLDGPAIKPVFRKYN